jgi:hypothetical protein
MLKYSYTFEDIGTLKVKIIFCLRGLSEVAPCHQSWIAEWVDWDTEKESLPNLVDREFKKQVEIYANVKYPDKVIHAFPIQVHDPTNGKYQCGSCEDFFDELRKNSCPYCGSGNFVEGCIDEPAPKES